jgi:hypothetical protein
MLLLGSALVPDLLILWYLYSRDKNPEPLSRWLFRSGRKGPFAARQPG